MAEGLLKNILRTFCVQALGFAVNLACGILIARHLGPTGRGDWAAITSVISIIATFSYFAAGYAIVYLRSSTDLTRHELFRAAIVISLVGTLICLTAALIGSAWLSQGSRAAFTHCLLLYGAGQLFANAGTFVSMIFLADRQFGRANLAGLLPRLLVLIGYGGLLLFRRFTVLDVVLVNIGASGLLLGWLLFWFRDAFSERSSLWPVALGRMLRYGIKVWLGLLAQAVTMRADQVIMAALLPRAVLGLYAVSVTVAELAGFFAGAAGFIIGPTAANLQGAELARAIGRSFRVTGLIVVGTALVMYAAGP
ncbi:MAG: oligosaccharide flippase family protein, partial [Armatimonadetes bacterium]|nr:oligosaccharide flippase family protein [Armatimonadota bacterium]